MKYFIAGLMLMSSSLAVSAETEEQSHLDFLKEAIKIQLQVTEKLEAKIEASIEVLVQEKIENFMDQNNNKNQKIEEIAKVAV